jgi:hypothetical protein
MRKNFTKNIALLLLIVFLIPSAVKFFHHHHHEHTYFNLGKDKLLYEYQEKCQICSFEFSVFLNSTEKLTIEKELYSDRYFNSYKSTFIAGHFDFSFLLRAPPVNKDLC